MFRTSGERLRASLEEMGKIGGTPAGGVTRLALTDEDKAARDLFAGWAAESGLRIRVDDLGNQYARLEGMDPEAAPVLLGSHLDTVPMGGRFDGAFGVLTALEVARTMAQAGIRTRRAVEVVNFTNEEGVRFDPAVMSSGVIAGKFSRDWVDARRALDGRTFEEELGRIGYRGWEVNRPRAIHAYLEAHIEQGPVLETEGLPLAAVDGILGRERRYVTLTGQPQHAGPSPMRTRRDAMVAAARIITAVRDLALAYPDPVVATVGYIKAEPGVISQIPAKVTIGGDLRHPTADGLNEITARADELVHRIAAEERVQAEIEVTSSTTPVAFDPDMVKLIEESIETVGAPIRRMTSSAGHDSKFIAEIAPAAMLFVRTLGGKSHCETEAVDWHDAHLAAEALLTATLRLAQ